MRETYSIHHCVMAWEGEYFMTLASQETGLKPLVWQNPRWAGAGRFPWAFRLRLPCVAPSGTHTFLLEWNDMARNSLFDALSGKPLRVCLPPCALLTATVHADNDHALA